MGLRRILIFLFLLIQLRCAVEETRVIQVRNGGERGRKSLKQLINVLFENSDCEE